MSENIISRDNLKLLYRKSPEIVHAYNLSDCAIRIFELLYNQQQNSITKIFSDNEGEYIQISRKIIADNIGKCVKTVIKYIKELVKVGLIKDKRMGVKELNRIYFKDVPEQFKVTGKKDKPIEDGLFSKVKEIISPVTSEFPREKIKDVIIACKENIDELRKAVEYTLTKNPDDVYGYLIDTLKRKHYDNVKVKPKEKESTPSSKPNFNNNVNNKPKPNKHLDILNHDWDIEKIMELEQVRISFELGHITKDEYERVYKELNIKF